MKTSMTSILLIIVCTFFTSIAQVLYKFGTNNLTPTLTGIITNYWLWSGLMLYGIAALLLVLSLKGGELSVIYPFIATSYVWVSLLSSYFFGEVLNAYKWIGVIAIVIGVSLIGVGSRR